jgi:hypothetical protein|tara:strand:+ start:98 stop:475 length:378 start_codon:yes stop_codon:yes gene_type:complete
MSNIKKKNVKILINQLRKELRERRNFKKDIEQEIRNRPELWEKDIDPGYSYDDLPFPGDQYISGREHLVEVIKNLKNQIREAEKTLGKPKTKSKAKPTIKKPVMKVKRRMGGIVTRGYGKALRGY